MGVEREAVHGTFASRTRVEHVDLLFYDVVYDTTPNLWFLGSSRFWTEVLAGWIETETSCQLLGGGASEIFSKTFLENL